MPHRGEVERDEALEAAALGLDAADDAGAAAERHDGDSGGRAGREDGGDGLGVGGREHGVGGALDPAAAQPDQVRVALAGGVADPVLGRGADRVLAAGRVDHRFAGAAPPAATATDSSGPGERLSAAELAHEHGLADGLSSPAAGLAPAVEGGVAPQLSRVGVAQPAPLRPAGHERALDPVERRLSVRPVARLIIRRAEPGEAAQAPPALDGDVGRPRLGVASRISSSALRRNPSNGVPSISCSQTIRSPGASRRCSGSRRAPAAPCSSRRPG